MSENYVDAKIKQLMKDMDDHVDCIRVFVSKPSDTKPGTTSCYTMGQGNFYAQYGQIKEWMVWQERKFGQDMQQDEGT